MQFELLTLAGVTFRGEAKRVVLTTTKGEIGILPHHETLTAIVKPGPVTVHTTKGVEHFAVFGGMLDVTPERIRLLADESEHADELIHSEIEAALKSAQELLSKVKEKHEIRRAQAVVDRHAVRMQVANIRRRHREARGQSR